MASHFAQPVETNAALYETQLDDGKIPVDVNGGATIGGVPTFPVSVENSNIGGSNSAIPVVVNDSDHPENSHPVEEEVEVLPQNADTIEVEHEVVHPQVSNE